MKTKISLLLISFFCGVQLFAQLRSMPIEKKTTIPVTTHQNVKKMPEAQPAKVAPPPAPTGLQKAVVNIIVGDDGKDKDTYTSIKINDGNKRLAALYGHYYNSQLMLESTGEYLPGDNETLDTHLETSVPTGEMKQVNGLPLPVTKEASLTDFTNNNGGSINILIKPTGHDTWKIKSFTVTLYFNNDPGSPRKMTWQGFTLSQDSKFKDLEFDKNFNPIQ